MKSPQHMRIIQIEITNACDKLCSNCTRLCGHHKKPFFMDFETFKRAADSLEGYKGIQSIMGGEPTLHPDLERFMRYLGSKFPKTENPFVYPQKDFIKQIHRREIANYEVIDAGDGVERIDLVGAGFYSNMRTSYKKYYELATDFFPYQCLNDHLNPVYHQPALITRKELGVPDDEWVKLRDKCWVQNEWSASITPKGAFFCEIAAALDMLLDGPGGWKIEPGWWKRTPEDFGDQLHWCELCGFALQTFTRDSAEEIDDVSPRWYERLKKMQTPKFKSGRVNRINIENGKISEESKKENKFFSSGMPYIERYEDRFNTLNSVLFTHEYEEAVINEEYSFGYELNKVIEKADDWIVLRSENAYLSDGFADKISKYVLNPGTMHYLDLSKSDDTTFVKNADKEQSGYVALFSKNALSLREFGFDGVAHAKNIEEIIKAWSPDKVVELSSKIDESANYPQTCKGIRYAVWGAGSAGSAAFDLITICGGEVVLAVDKNPKKHGSDFYGITVEPPESLIKRSSEFDILIVANYTYFSEIKKEALSLGIKEDTIKYVSDLL